MKQMKKYDIIIGGASFAGLALASRLKNRRVLLIDREDIGSHVRSACGTTVNILKKVNCEESILQVFDVTTLHTKNKEIDIPLPEKFCTIDFEKFCRLLNKQNNAKFLRADVEKTVGMVVFTSEGNFEADIIVDCTGWQAVLASSLDKNYVRKNMLSFGIETEIPYKKEDKLRFFIDSDIVKNCAAWIFPCKKTARFGVGSYDGKTKLLPNLKKLLSKYDLKLGKIHGGSFCYYLKDPVVRNIFVVGCGAGQTLPLTGEGIRRSINFGLICGEIIQKVSDEKISLEQGQNEYRDLVLRDKRNYNRLLKAQNMLSSLPNWKLNLIARLLSTRPIARWAWRKYEKI